MSIRTPNLPSETRSGSSATKPTMSTTCATTSTTGYGRAGAVGPKVLAEAQFRTTNLSSWAARTKWLKSTGLEQVAGAGRQDSLFFLQVFAAASRFAAVEQPTYRYHMEAAGSMVNTITTDYFHKALLRERAQRDWLQQIGLPGGLPSAAL